MRIILLFLLIFNFCHSQKTCEEQIIDSYNKIEINDLEMSSISEIKNLSEQSKKLNFTTGTLRGLVLLQRCMLVNSNYILSGRYGEEAEVLANRLKDYNTLSMINLYRGKINLILDKFPEAEANLKNAVSYGERITNEADKHIQLCRIYATYAGMYEGLNNPNAILEYTKKSLRFIETTPTKNLTEYQKSKYYYLYIYELMNMGNIYTFGRDVLGLEQAEPYFQRVLEFRHTAPEYFKICETDIYLSVSNFYLKKGDYQKSIDYAYSHLEVEKVKKSPRERMFAYRNLKDAYGSIKNTHKENEYLRLYIALKDSISSAEKEVIVQQSRDQIKKSDKKNHRSKISLLLTGSLVILSIVSGSWFVIYRNNKKYRIKYEKMIDKLQNETLNNNNKLPVSYNSISSVTEKKLLIDLENFERSEIFLKKDITISFLSNEFNTNTKYLSEVIKNNKSQNFSNYINNLRINYIVRKLYDDPKYREYKLSYLAEECGFTSYRVFILAFKKLNGVTPSYFIQNLNDGIFN